MYKDALQQVFRLAHFPVERYGPPHWKVTKKNIEELRLLPYFEQWKLALESEWFHIKLEDHSLFIFDDYDNSPSYSFLHAPIVAETIRAHLNRREIAYRDRAKYQDDYEALFETAEPRQHVTPIRFDLDAAGYKPGLHPKAHLHIGLDNEVRLGLQRELSPLSFVLFVMRHMYPACWERLLDHPNPSWLHKIMHGDLLLVDDQFWCDKDRIELHLE